MGTSMKLDPAPFSAVKVAVVDCPGVVAEPIIVAPDKDNPTGRLAAVYLIGPSPTAVRV
jgi:hypothetical protein